MLYTTPPLLPAPPTCSPPRPESPTYRPNSHVTTPSPDTIFQYRSNFPILHTPHIRIHFGCPFHASPKKVVSFSEVARTRHQSTSTGSENPLRHGACGAENTAMCNKTSLKCIYLRFWTTGVSVLGVDVDSPECRV